VGGITVNRFCASGLSAVQMAADRIRVGEAEVMIAAGVEHEHGAHDGQLALAVAQHLRARRRRGIAYGMGLTAEKVAQQWKVSREAQDAFALQSHRRRSRRSRPASSRPRSPHRSDRAPPRPGHRRSQPKTRTVSLDEGARPDTTLEGLAKLDRVRGARLGHGGQQLADLDGAGALILASESAVKRFGHAAGALRSLPRGRAAASWASAPSRPSRPRCATPA
jgi:acetyl-CoA acyltransferase